MTSLSASPDRREVAVAIGGFTVAWPCIPRAWLSLACVFTADVRAEDVAGYAGGAQPKDECP
ncbi:hypothetical protein OG288_43065 [Streptomyces tauricus]|uniref:Uncharacterized protein n=1 Tax=Streptomyces tauricus TaxID=68274 RepID=A0ABZ1JS73_9ACTN|nr:hypothetical protein [Streptomyces tauricus]MCW8103187.1 hypothetical protein [Streptomyces tauricus]